MRFNLFRNPAAFDGSALSHKEAKKLILCGKAPANLYVSGHLNLSNNPTLEALPEGLTAASLDLDRLSIGCTGLLTIAVTEIAKRMECGED